MRRSRPPRPSPEGPILALETSVRPASIAIATSVDAAPVLRVLDDDRSHASDLVPAIRDVLREAGVDPADVRLVAVGTGPGSYTGLRVGAAAALGIRMGASAAVVGVPSFDAIALRALRPGESCAVVRDAFGGHVYAARYRRDADELVTVDAAWCARPDDVRARIAGDVTWIADDAALRALGEPTEAEVRDVAPRADAVWTLGVQRFAASGDGGPEDLRPLYLRAFGD